MILDWYLYFDLFHMGGIFSILLWSKESQKEIHEATKKCHKDTVELKQVLDGESKAVAILNAQRAAFHKTVKEEGQQDSNQGPQAGSGKAGD